MPLVVLFLSFGAPVPAPQRAEPPSINALIEAHVAARGGTAVWQSVTTLQRQQVNNIITVTSAWRRNGGAGPHMARVQHSSEYGADDRRFDGSTGWTSDRDGARDLSPAESLVLQEDALNMVELLALTELGAKAGLDGPATFNGNRAWRVGLTLKSGTKLTLFLDQTTSLELGRTKVSRAPDGSTEETTITLGDYKPVAGLLLPHIANSSIVSFVINAAILDAEFRRPGRL